MSPSRGGNLNSIAMLVIGGFTATALPLVIALVVGSIQVSELTALGRETMVQAVSRARFSEYVADELVSMERNVRQFALLSDPELRELVRRRHRQLQQTLTRLEATEPGEQVARLIGDIRRNAARLEATVVEGGAPGGELDVSLNQFAGLHQTADALRRATEASMQAELNTLTRESRQVQEAFIWQSSLLGAFGVVLALAFVVAILRPIRQINRAIEHLGAEEFDDEIKVKGPYDLRGIGERLDWLRLRLQDVDRQKSEFVRHMSHELKTPLANIRESTSLLLDDAVGSLGTPQREVVSIIDSSSRRLHRLVDNLINFARWQEQRAVAMTTFDLAKLIDGQIKEQQMLVLSRKLALVVNRPPRLMVRADSERMTTLIANVLSNAIKFSPEGGEITFAVTVDDGDVVIDVTDSGPGIPEGIREQIFEPFVQGEHTAGHYEGTGIGLSLVRSCLEAHHGEGGFLAAQQGAHFRARLPILEGENID